VKHSRSSAEKLLGAGWTPQHSLDEALATTLEFFRK
jgi:UDP-glucose 4-epimerase